MHRGRSAMEPLLECGSGAAPPPQPSPASKEASYTNHARRDKFVRSVSCASTSSSLSSWSSLSSSSSPPPAPRCGCRSPCAGAGPHGRRSEVSVPVRGESRDQRNPLRGPVANAPSRQRNREPCVWTSNGRVTAQLGTNPGESRCNDDNNNHKSSVHFPWANASAAGETSRSLLADSKTKLPSVVLTKAIGATTQCPRVQRSGPTNNASVDAVVGQATADPSEPDDTFVSSFSFIRESLRVPQPATGRGDLIAGKGAIFGPVAGERPPRRTEGRCTGGSEPSCRSTPHRSHSVSSASSCDVSSVLSDGGASESEPDGAPCGRRDTDTGLGSAGSSDAGSLTAPSSPSSSSPSSYEPASRWELLLETHKHVLRQCAETNSSRLQLIMRVRELKRQQMVAAGQDDFEAAEQVSKRLEETQAQLALLSFQIPSGNVELAAALRSVVFSASCVSAGKSQDELWRDPCFKIQQKKKALQERISELRRSLSELEEEERRVGVALDERDRNGVAVADDRCGRGSPLTPDLLGTLEDSLRWLLASLATPGEVERLREQEKTLALSVKELSTKVAACQLEVAALGQKISDAETQLRVLTENKASAVAERDFALARRLVEEGRRLAEEGDMARWRLQALQGPRGTTGTRATGGASHNELERFRQQHREARAGLETLTAQHEQKLRDQAMAHSKVLQDFMNRCKNPFVTRVWEADLQACSVILQSLAIDRHGEDDLGQGGVTAEGADGTKVTVEATEVPAEKISQPESVWLDRETAKETLCFTENGLPVNPCEVVSDHPNALPRQLSDDVIQEQCESISNRLLCLEEQLQHALDTRDQRLAQRLQEEITEVKGTLQSMLSLLEEEEPEDEAEQEEWTDWE
uniref:Disrupted in schizophrenia 1 protein n=1 Tax=Petromyzon marinus TaxID=7757 RepID=A0AAJ7TMY2_PETMA|nr:disrupted in schizophrenia 1 protein [Petromyzon marinus]